MPAEIATANFAERRLGEVRRISLPRRWVDSGRSKLLHGYGEPPTLVVTSS
jgi:hypothetical protein